MSTSNNSDLPAAAQTKPAFDELNDTHPVAEPASDIASINAIETDVASSENASMPSDGLLSLAPTENALEVLDALSAAIEGGRTESRIEAMDEDDDRCEFALDATTSESSAHDSDPAPMSEEIQSEEHSTEEHDEDATVLTNPQTCLAGLPGDVLDLILGRLLLNPELGRTTSVSRDNGYGVHAQYGLHPYVFYAACLPNQWRLSQDEQRLSSPLKQWPRNDGPPNQDQVRPLQEVQTWLIVLHIANEDGFIKPRYPITSIRSLCHILCKTTPRQVDVAVVTKGVQRDLANTAYDDIETVMIPFKLLRGVEKFTLRDATPLEIPQSIPQDDDTGFFESHPEDHAVLQVEMLLSCTSHEPFEFPFEMYERLLQYAQTFESHEPFRLEMAMGLGVRINEDTD